MLRYRCVVWPSAAALLGLAISAWAQATPDPAAGAPDWLALLAQGGPLPVALATIAWLLTRSGGIPVVHTVQLAPESLQAVRDLTAAVAAVKPPNP